MKITIDIPDTTLSVFVSMIWDEFTVYKMGTSALDTDDLHSGQVIKLPREQENDG